MHLFPKLYEENYDTNLLCKYNGLYLIYVVTVRQGKVVYLVNHGNMNIIVFVPTSRLAKMASSIYIKFQISFLTQGLTYIGG